MQYHTTISTILYHMIQYIRGVIEESSLDPLSQIQLKRDDAAPAIYMLFFKFKGIRISPTLYTNFFSLTRLVLLKLLTSFYKISYFAV